MPRLTRTLALTVLAAALSTGIAAAQQSPAPRPPAAVPANPDPRGAQAKAEPSTMDQSLHQAWDKTKAMTRKEWDVAKKKWAMEKVKWQDCNRQADGEKLAAPKSWSFIANCMTRT